MEHNTGKIAILIVEDNPDDAELIKLTLQQKGFEFEAIIVEGEEDFIQQLQSRQWNLIICDYSMPSFDALKALQIKNEKQRELPFILVSGTVGEELAVEAMLNGADDYVMKDNLKRLPVAAERELRNIELHREMQWTEKKYRLLFENIPDGILFTDADGYITEANDAAGHMLNPSSNRDLLQYNFFDLLLTTDSGEPLNPPGQLDHSDSFKGEALLNTLDNRQIHIALTGKFMDNLRDERTGSFIFSDITKRIDAENQLRVSLHEKQVLLSEIHHRVKNNMAIISGLLYMQSEYVEDPNVRMHLLDSMNRIKSMATVHEMLYQSNSVGHIDFQYYLDTLINEIRKTLSFDARNIQVSTDCDNIKLTITRAIPCGLIVNELLTNAFEHAFPERQSGNIVLSMKEQEEAFSLRVKDDGRGMNPLISADKKSGNMGMMIIDALTRQLNAEMEITTEKGTQVDIHIPFTS